MSLITQLVGFGLRQVIGDNADSVVQVVEIVEQRFRDHSRTLPKALDQAHQRAWQALGVALAGDGLLDRIKVFFASGDDKGVREQVQLFLKSNAFSFDGTSDEFRAACLDELKRLRKSGLLSTQAGSSADIARQAAGFRRHTDPQGLIEESRRAVAGVADALADAYPNLARLLRTPTPAGPPLLAAAFCYFFRREVETDDELAHGLFFDGLRQLSVSQAKAFGEVGKALTALGGQFDALFEQLGRIETAVVETHAVAVETHGAVLDLQAELQRLGGLHLANAGEVRSLLEQVLSQLGQVGMTRGEVRPGNSCSIRGEDERRAVKALLARFRQLPSEEQRQTPALLNGLGKLQVGAGDFAEARQTFTEVVQVVGEASEKAEASYNAYQAALEEKKWEAALAALREASTHDPQRFAPFPLHRYEPQRILGAGGFGTAILCHDRNFDEAVVVKTLHAADLARGVDDVFREARILRRLSHPAIIGVRDCEYADPAHKARPYLVMDYFPGATLQEFVDEQGPLGLENLLSMAVQAAEGVRAAHAQGVLHRDLKPANLLVRKDGDNWKVKIIDFGLALPQQTVETSRVRIGANQKSILDWSVAGTLDYAPPEQLGRLAGVPPGPYSDVFAFGKMCLYSLFKITESSERLWKETPAPGRAKLRKLLEQCIERDLTYRLRSFEPLVDSLKGMKLGRPGAEQWTAWEADQRRRQEDKERLAREEAERARQQDLARFRQEGEKVLVKQVRDVLDRTAGQPNREDTMAANVLFRRYGIPADRAKRIFSEVWKEWRQTNGAKPQHKAGDLYTNSLGMKFAWIPPGTFLMGSPADELETSLAGRVLYLPRGLDPNGMSEEAQRMLVDETQHRVTLAKGFWLGVHVVTQRQWQAVLGENPSYSKGDDLPVESVSWSDAVAFCHELSKKDGKTYSLPTEAQWEYACRAGTTTPFHFGDTISLEQANCQTAMTVGSFQPNAWGLYDMHGAVWQWCADWYGAYPREHVTDPTGPASGDTRVARGGEYSSSPVNWRSGNRLFRDPGDSDATFGCRVVLCLD